MTTTHKTTLIAPQPRGKRRIAELAEGLLSPAGVRLNGDRPFDVTVKDEAFYDHALPRGLTGLREAYVDGWWDTEQLDVLTYRLIRCGVNLSYGDKLSLALANLSARLRNQQNRKRSLQVRRHYDLGNDLFRAMLDKRMNYSCAYWKGATTLDEAQEAKLELICRKVGLRPGMRVLDIGCGWGSFAKFAAERYDVSVLGVTLSHEQVQLGRTLCAGLPVALEVRDYRDLNDGDGKFDAVVSVGMFEHVGYKNYPDYMRIVRRHLKPDGLFLLHTIGGNNSEVTFDPWFRKYIFPNAMLPSARQITAACEGVMLMEDWHSFGNDYDRTLMAWFENFERNWPQLEHKYGERFYRMWKCYLLTCAGLFRAREIQLWQIVFSPQGVLNGYSSIR